MVKAFDSKSNEVRILLAASNLRALKKQEKLKEGKTHRSCLGTLIAAMAEWLRRLTRNQMGSSRIGLNPTRSDFSVFFDKCVDLYYWWSSRPTILGNGFIIFFNFRFNRTLINRSVTVLVNCSLQVGFQPTRGNPI